MRYIRPASSTSAAITYGRYSAIVGTTAGGAHTRSSATSGPGAGSRGLRDRSGSTYAGDLVVLCHSRQQAEQVQARLAGWLKPRGLAINQDKTKIARLEQGVDFLGFEIRRFGGKLLTKPSRDAMRRIRARLSSEATALRGANADVVIARLNPVITGWAAYYRIGVSSRAFGKLDTHMWRLVWKWARHAHPNKSRHWVVARYFGRFNPSRNNKWLFGSRDTGRYLRRFSWTKIVRQVMVAGGASPDDPDLADYWVKRRERNRPPVSPATWHLMRRQRGRCPLCRGLLLYASHEPHDEREWEQWHTVIRNAVRKDSDLYRDGPRHAGRASRIPPHPRTLPPTSRWQQAQHSVIGPA